VTNLAQLGPGTSTAGDVTAISSLDSTGALIFESGDLPRSRAFRMEITVTPFADAQFSQPVTDSNAGNDVISFWLMRAC
jgi:hypothetical protein